MADKKSLLGNVVGYMKRAMDRGMDSGMPGMTKHEADEYFKGKHDDGFYGHIKGGSEKASKKMKGCCK